ncbi:nuclear receptor coactivator 5 isoform X2 [Denticeps clupeoides]|uniref:nuclear receptor coactivator 5 isoform X2 n=1 Tax=Denticeps clupeoides TaxID=299321 RepID=UPI0010A4B7B7|nr:nuclear receptor coactivator 5-like isoform X2 [Denticeps clupeoides]
MTSWGKIAGGRRPQPNAAVGNVKPLRSFRPVPYPLREERSEELKDHEGYEGVTGYEAVKQETDYSAMTDYSSYEQLARRASPKRYNPGEKRNSLYDWFYKVLQGGGAKKPADCIVLSVNNQNMDYAKSLGHCLQERGLSVEMIYLQVESGLTRALQDVRSDGSPLCILVEQTNVTLSSCTVIIFSESLKIHRNMPKDQALEFVMVEFGRMQVKCHDRDPVELATRAAELTDDYLTRDKLEKHVVSSETRHLMLLLAQGAHLYPEELSTISDYIRSRQELLEGSSVPESSTVTEPVNSLPSTLGSPPPLLQTPPMPGPSGRERPGPPASSGVKDRPPAPLLGLSGSYPTTKPPPLLSLHSVPVPPHRALLPRPPRGLPVSRGASQLHGPPPTQGARGFPPARGPAGHHGPRPPPQNGPMLMARGPPQPLHGSCVPPPSLTSHHLGSQSALLPVPGVPPPRPTMPRH